MRRCFAAILRFFTGHAGKAVAYVVLADTLITMPDLLGWAAAAFLVYRASCELRAAFRRLDAAGEATQARPATAVAAEDLLLQAARLNMIAKGDLCPAVIIHHEPARPANPPPRRPDTRLSRA